MDEQSVEKFLKTTINLRRIYDELNSASKKNPNDAVNPFKLNIINQFLKEANDILGEVNKPIADFLTFTDEHTPSNSDALLVVGQYLDFLEKFRSDRVGYVAGLWYWRSKSGKLTYIETDSPRYHSSTKRRNKSMGVSASTYGEEFEKQ